MTTIKAAAGSATTYLRDYLNKHTNSYQKTMEALSSGNKYNSISDGPVEVCKSAKLSIQINTNNRASSNASIGSNVLEIAESTESDVYDNIARIRDLCTEAKTGTYTSTDKDAMIEEIRARLNYIDQSSKSTSFNGIKLLDGSSSSFVLQVGPMADENMDIGNAFVNIKTDNTGLDIALNASVNGSNWTEDQINTYIAKLDTASQTLLNGQAQCGSYINRLDFVTQNLEGANLSLTENKSIISDADTAEVSADLVRYQVLQQASVSILAQANQVPQMALQLLNK